MKMPSGSAEFRPDGVVGWMSVCEKQHGRGTPKYACGRNLIPAIGRPCLHSMLRAAACAAKPGAGKSNTIAFSDPPFESLHQKLAPKTIKTPFRVLQRCQEGGEGLHG